MDDEKFLKKIRILDRMNKLDKGVVLFSES